MNKISLSHDLSVSPIILGVWRLVEWKKSFQELETYVRSCIDLGVDTFDHADIYGNYTCEQEFGKVLRAYPSLRQRMHIVTKCGIKLITDKYPSHKVKHYDTSKAHIIKSVENSLNNLQTDVIDLLLIHRPDPMMNPEEVAEAFTQLHDAGKVQYFGVSNFTPAQYDMLYSYLDYDLVTNQVEISLKNTSAFHDGSVEHAMMHKIPLMAWSPLGGGSLFNPEIEENKKLATVLSELSEKYNVAADQILLAWLLCHPAKILPILGTGKIDRVKSAVEARAVPLTRQDWFALLEAAEGKEVA